MSIGPFGGIQGSAAGAPLSTTKGSESNRGQQQAGAAERQAEAEKKADDAAGIGTTEEDQQASDRDADGRRMYDDTLEIESDDQQEPDKETAEPQRPSTARGGEKGNTLDLTG